MTNKVFGVIILIVAITLILTQCGDGAMLDSLYQGD